jgi:hypothetical protein
MFVGDLAGALIMLYAMKGLLALTQMSRFGMQVGRK